MWWTVVNKIQPEYFLAQLNSIVLYLSLSAVICRGSSVLQSTCLHSEPPWAHSSWAPVWRCCQVAARCPLRMTSECTRLVSEGVLGAPHLYAQDTQRVTIKIYVADYYSAFYTSTIVQCAWLLTKNIGFLAHQATPCFQYCLIPLTIVEVAQVACVEKEVCSEKISKAAFAWSEGQRRVEVHTTCPVRLTTQIVTWTTLQIKLRLSCWFHCLMRQTQLLYGLKFPLCDVKIFRCNETVGTISGHEFRILV